MHTAQSRALTVSSDLSAAMALGGASNGCSRERRKLVEAFDLFVEQQFDSLLRLARVLTGSPTEAEDVVQESLLRAHRKWDQVSTAQHPAAYMRRVLVNVHHSRRRSKRWIEVPLSASAMSSSDFTQDDRGKDHAEEQALRQVIALLPMRQRTALVLRYYEEMEVIEIADAMRLRPSTVRSNLSRALERLRKELTAAAAQGGEPCVVSKRQ